MRGIALLGILLMNIPFFAMPERFTEPWRADPGNANFWVHAVNTFLFEGKMRALFSAVFGAGIVLFTMGKEKAGRPSTGLFYRRMIWLTIFGLAHAHLLLWMGDILYFYGLVGMLAFLSRRVAPRWLAMGVPLVYRAGLLRGLFTRLRAVGQMAFTNYIMQTVICSLVFFGYGLNQFAEWQYYQLYWLVAGIWVLQLIVSPLWLRGFQFGPLEWLWRTLTYGARPPFLRRPVRPAAPLRGPAPG